MCVCVFCIVVDCRAAVAVLRSPNETRHAYYVLVINQYGVFDTWLDQTLILGADTPGRASPRDLEGRLLAYFHEHWCVALL